jgi:hypothetical protein
MADGPKSGGLDWISGRGTHATRSDLLTNAGAAGLGGRLKNVNPSGDPSTAPRCGTIGSINGVPSQHKMPSQTRPPDTEPETQRRSCLFSPMMRELRTTTYQWTRPFVVDSTLTERTFGLTPTPIDTARRTCSGPWRSTVTSSRR